jgi:thiol:disulfide interchange protein
MTSTPEKNAVNHADKVRNFLIAIVAIALTIAIFLGLKTQSPVTTLASLAEQSTPLEIATNNDKPTLMEFYADWCTSCQEIWPN